jgi:hypothetical protein
MTMRFTAETLVAEAIAAEPAVIERLATLHPAFEKLRNPVLRKVMAGLVTFREAAEVAGVGVEAVLAAANGAAPAPLPPPAAEPLAAAPAAPLWVENADLHERVALDVRPILAEGGEPLGAIMRLAATVPPGGLLILDAPFDPVPLRRVLGSKGFEAHARALAPGHWRVWFRRPHEAQPAPAPAAAPAQSAAEAKQWRRSGELHVDVRGLEPPQPLLAVLKLIEAGTAFEVLVVHHEREPVFLYPALAARGWRHELLPTGAGDVQLRITRGGA